MGNIHKHFLLYLGKTKDKMANKLQEITDQLYEQGLSKGKEEGEKFLAAAKAKAAKTVEDARAEAEKIIAQACKEAEEIKSKTISDLKTASEQSLQATKKDLENLIVGRLTSAKVDSALSDAGFVKEIIKVVAEKFRTSESCDISLILPEALKEELEPWVAGELKEALSGEIKADFSKKVGGGFSIGPADGSWFISMTEDTFKKLIAEYLRPVTRKLLFGE